MPFLKENRGLILLALLLIPAFYMDKTSMSWIREQCTFHSALWYRPIDYFVKISTHGTTLIVLSLAVFLGCRHCNRRLSETGRTLFAGLITAGITVQVFKHIIGRARPRVTYDTVFAGPSLHVDYDSFPSGHTTMLFCLAFMLARYYPRYRIPVYLYAVVGSADRMLGLSHFPSDVLAGAMLGTIVAKIVLSGGIPAIKPYSPAAE